GMEGADPKNLRTMVDNAKNQMGSGVVMLANINGDKIGLIAGVTKDLIGKVKAGDLVKMVAEQVGGKGGGRPDMAQAGGTDVSALPEAMKSVQPWLEERL
ncbi:DHHA1 domain-containing protein, partial [Vibrio fortis]